MSYFKYNLKLTDGQKQKLLKSYQKRVPLTLRLKHSQLTGNDVVFFTKLKLIELKSRKGMELVRILRFLRLGFENKRVVALFHH